MGGLAGTAIASLGYLGWYAADGGSLSSRGIQDMLGLMALVGSVSTAGSVAGAIAIQRPKALPSQSDMVRAWLSDRQTILALPPETVAEIEGVLEDV